VCADVVVERSRRGPLALAVRVLCLAVAEQLEEATWVEVLPLAFAGRYDEDEAIKAVWEEVRHTACAPPMHGSPGIIYPPVRDGDG
jgi:hypothetical protein